MLEITKRDQRKKGDDGLEEDRKNIEDDGLEE